MTLSFRENTLGDNEFHTERSLFRPSLPPSPTRHLWKKLGEVGDQEAKLLFQEDTPAHLTEPNAEEQISPERRSSLTSSKTIGGGGGGVEDQRSFHMLCV